MSTHLLVSACCIWLQNLERMRSIWNKHYEYQLISSINTAVAVDWKCWFLVNSIAVQWISKAWLIRCHLGLEVAIHFKEGGCFDSCSIHPALFSPVYKGKGGEQGGRRGMASTMQTFFLRCPAMQTDEVEGITLSKNGQVGAIKLAAEM